MIRPLDDPVVDASVNERRVPFRARTGRIVGVRGKALVADRRRRQAVVGHLADAVADLGDDLV